MAVWSRAARGAIGVLLLAAADAGQASAERSMTVDDVLAFERLDRVSVSPDGALIAAVVLRGALPGEIYGRTSYEVDPSRGDVWIIDRATGARRNVTKARARSAGAWCATWSPDGQSLAFLSTRPEGAEPRGGDNVRLYVWDRSSGHIRRLGDWGVMTQTRYGAAIHHLDIAGPGLPSGDSCTAGEDKPGFAWLDRRRLLVAMLPPGTVSGLIDESERSYRHIAATHDALRAGQAPIVSASGSGTERTRATTQTEASLAIVDAATGVRIDIAPVPAYPFNGSLGIRVSPDGTRAAVLATTGGVAPTESFSWPRDDGDWLVEKRLGFVDLAAGAAIRWITLPATAKLPVQLGSWTADGRGISLIARADASDRTAVPFSVDAASGIVTGLATTPEPQSPTLPAGVPENAEVLANDGRGILWRETTPQGTFVRAMQSGKPSYDLLSVNRQLADIDLGRTIVFDYAGVDGAPLKAAVLLPPGYNNAARLPVITWVYGGYVVHGPDDYFLDPQMPGIYNLRLYAARGYAVLIPSIPLKRDGSQDHLTSLAPSVLPAIDKLVAMGIADPDRVGVFGQSYGGYTALGLATQSERFRAVVAAAPLSDLTAFYGSFDPTARGYPGIEHEKSANGIIAELGTAALQKPFYADPDRYRGNSPLEFVGRVTAPVLLIHGEHDARGSSYQSEAFFTGLWRQGKTARILRYWGENHSLAASPATVRDIVREVTAWFDRYLPPGAIAKPEASRPIPALNGQIAQLRGHDP